MELNGFFPLERWMIAKSQQKKTSWRGETHYSQFQQYEAKHELAYSVIEVDSLDLSHLHSGEPVHATDGLGRANGNSPIRAFKIRESRNLFTAPCWHCLHMDLYLTENPQISYRTGDHLAVWPINRDEEVERLIRVMGLSDRKNIPIPILFLHPSVMVRIPTPKTLETMPRYYLEICASVSRDKIQGLHEFVPSFPDKEVLHGMSIEKDAFAQFLAANYITMVRLFELAAAPILYKK